VNPIGYSRNVIAGAPVAYLINQLSARSIS
jgi:hypothetical protein